MTNVGSLVLILVCVGIGYVLEPIFFSDSNQSPLAPKPEEVASADEDGEESAGDVAEDVEPAPPAPDPAPDAELGEITIDLSKVTAADFPEKVTLKVPYTLADEESGVTMQLKEGAKVQPVRLEGEVLVFRLGGLPIEGDTHVDNTDFTELVVPIMLKRLQDAKLDEKTVEDEMETDDMAEPAPDPEVEPEPVVMPETDTETEPELVTDSDSEPVDEPVDEPVADSGEKLDAAALVALMKASVAGGEVTEFEAKDVISWKAGEAMEFDGKSYQTGLVTFKAETILGVQEHDAIALVENGAVVKWVWAKTKLEMK